MDIQPTSLNGALIIQPNVFGDDRGWFYELYNQEQFTAAGVDVQFVQDNRSSSVAGVLRGLHFQRPPKAQGKLVSCTKGRLWDVAVDLRKDSMTFKQWFGLELSAEKKNMLYIPSGFAHGFYALEDCEMLYKCTEIYDASTDGGIIWNDSEIGIDWPIHRNFDNGSHDRPIISDKDTQLLLLAEIDNPF